MVSIASTKIAPLVLSSTFNNTGVPASGDQKRTEIVLAPPMVKGIGLAKPPIVKVVPAQVWVPKPLSSLTTVFVASVGSTLILSICPPKLPVE